MKRKILIIEDNPHWRDYLTELCEEAAEDLPMTLFLNDGDQPAPEIDVEISLAEQLEPALGLLNQHESTDRFDKRYSQFSLFTVDLNLAGSAVNANGLKLLKQISERYENGSMIVISGETDIQFAIDALQKYRAAVYIRKGDFDADGFVTLAQLCILYAEVVALLGKWEWRPTRLAQKMWKHAQTLLADDLVYEPNFNADPQALFSQRLDPDTSLPNEDWIEQHLTKLMSIHSGWSLIVIGIINLNYLSVAKHTNSRAADVLKLLGQIAEEELNAQPHAYDIVGHYLEQNKLAIVAHADHIETIVARVNKRFHTKIKPYYHIQDWEDGELSILINGQERQVELLHLQVGRVDASSKHATLLDISDLANENQRRLVD